MPLNPHRRLFVVSGSLFSFALLAFGLTGVAATRAAGPSFRPAPAVVSIVPRTAVHSPGDSSASMMVPPRSAAAVCPKCGRVHANGSPSSAQPTVTSGPAAGGVAENRGGGAIVPASFRAAASPAVSSGGTQNVLAVLNQQRSRQGLSGLRYDPALQAVAERRVRLMASTGTKSHPPGSFAPGRYEGVGWSSSYSPSGVHACYTSDPNMTVAGAAMARGRDGVYFAVVYR